MCFHANYLKITDKEYLGAGKCLKNFVDIVQKSGNNAEVSTCNSNVLIFQSRLFIYLLSSETVIMFIMFKCIDACKSVSDCQRFH